jgi:hypothetical protein
MNAARDCLGRQMTKTLPYQEGTWFAMPLRQGGYAIGMIARMAPRGRIVLAYFFGPKWDIIPALGFAEGLQSKDAVNCLRIGDLGLIDGSWHVLGVLPNWNRQAWPMPTLVRRDELSKRAWRSVYSDSDPSKLTREEPIPYEGCELERDALYGYGAAELLLTKLLG